MGIISYVLHCTQYTVHCTLYTDVCHCSALLLQGRRAQNSGEGAGTQEFFSGVM